METICGNCGEMEKLADVHHLVGIVPDEKGHIKTRAILLTRKDEEVEAFRGTKTEGVEEEVVEDRRPEKLYSNTRTRIGNDKENVENFREVDIIMPSEGKHGGTLTYTRDKTTTDMGVRKVFDGINSNNIIRPSKTASSIKYITQDISQAILSAYSDEVGVVDGELPLMLMVDIMIDKADLTTARKLQNISAQRYHNLIRAHLFDKSSDRPKNSCDFKIYLGNTAALAELYPYINNNYGLNSFSLGRDESGLFLDLSFNNNPPPKPELDALYRKIGPLVMQNSHKLATLSSL